MAAVVGVFLLLLLIFAPIITKIGRYVRERKEMRNYQYYKKTLDNFGEPINPTNEKHSQERQARYDQWEKRLYNELNYVDAKIDSLFDVIYALYYKHGILLYAGGVSPKKAKTIYRNERKYLKENTPVSVDCDVKQLPIIERIYRTKIFGDKTIFDLYQNLLVELSKYKKVPKKKEAPFTIKNYRLREIISLILFPVGFLCLQYSTLFCSLLDEFHPLEFPYGLYFFLMLIAIYVSFVVCGRFFIRKTTVYGRFKDLPGAWKLVQIATPLFLFFLTGCNVFIFFYEMVRF